MIEKVPTLDGLPDDLIDTKAAAKKAKCHLRCIYRWLLRGKLRGWSTTRLSALAPSGDGQTKTS